MAAPAPDPTPAQPTLGTAHRRRLREMWRSAGWPYQDLIEAELLAAGLLARERDAQGRDTLRVTDAGVDLLAHTLHQNRRARDAHEHLVARVAREMQRAGRVVWRGLSLRARVGDGAAPADAAAGAADAAPEPAGSWVIAQPDVYSIRHTTVEDFVEPIAHEIKVQRSDLLADLRRPTKGEAYRWLSSECWYVLREGIASADEIPEGYGVMLAPPSGALVVARPAPRRPMRLPFAVWMALARAHAEPADEEPQAPLAPPDGS